MGNRPIYWRTEHILSTWGLDTSKIATYGLTDYSYLEFVLDKDGKRRIDPYNPSQALTIQRRFDPSITEAEKYKMLQAYVLDLEEERQVGRR